MGAVGSFYDVTLGFLPEHHAIEDPERPGLRRAGTRAEGPSGAERVDQRIAKASDLSAGWQAGLGLRTGGFDLVDLSDLDVVQEHCAQVRLDSRIEDEAAAAIRRGLEGEVLTTAGGDAYRVQYLAEEGFLMRTTGPNGLSLAGQRTEGMNGHGQATSVHIDQDVYGTPLAQVMDGRAPTLLVHDSPDDSCHDAPMFLANLWIPLQQPVQPLCLADGRSIDRRRHQLRYGLPTGEFLERNEELGINDIWLLLHDPGQEWFFCADLDFRSAWLFNTLSTAHGAGTLPGEDVAEACYLMLGAAEEASALGDPDGLLASLSPADAMTPEGGIPSSVGDAIDAMLAVARTAVADPAGCSGLGGEAWRKASEAARRGSVRQSLELRAVVVPAD